MGTSTSQRSPNTPEWRSVRDLYRKKPISGRTVVSAIARAVSDEFVRDMAGEAPALCLAAAVREPPSAEEVSRSPAAACARFYESVRAAIFHSTSRQAELALEAAQRLLLRGAQRGDPAQRTREFLAEYLAATFAYLCARDASDFVGGEGLATVGEEHELLDQVRQITLEAGRAAEVDALVELCTARQVELRELQAALLAVLTAVFSALRRGVARG